MLAKTLVLAFLVAIVVALLMGGRYLVKDSSQSRRAMRALTWRVGLQIGLILFLVLCYFMGWIKPHGIGG